MKNTHPSTLRGSAEYNAGVLTEFAETVLKSGQNEFSLGLRKVPVIAGRNSVVVLELPDATAPLVTDLAVGELESGQIIKSLSLRRIPPSILALQIVFPSTAGDLSVKPVLALSFQVIAVAVLTDPFGQ
jgi:hypothetical protein